MPAAALLPVALKPWPVAPPVQLRPLALPLPVAAIPEPLPPVLLARMAVPAAAVALTALPLVAPPCALRPCPVPPPEARMPFPALLEATRASPVALMMFSCLRLNTALLPAVVSPSICVRLHGAGAENAAGVIAPARKVVLEMALSAMATGLTTVGTEARKSVFDW